MKNLTFLLLVAISLIYKVIADQIVVYGPPEGGIYRAKDIMDIRYKVKTIGMTKLWTASTSLKHDGSNDTINGFPASPWKEGPQGRHSIHTIWIIPDNIAPGTYTLAVGGNSTYLCSKAGNGTAPFKRCNSKLYTHRTFTIAPQNATIHN